jgi:hypothetical protein
MASSREPGRQKRSLTRSLGVGWSGRFAARMSAKDRCQYEQGDQGHQESQNRS